MVDEKVLTMHPNAAKKPLKELEKKKKREHKRASRAKIMEGLGTWRDMKTWIPNSYV